MNRPARPVIRQTFLAYGLTVGVVPTPILATGILQALYTTIVISNPAVGVSILIGDSGVSLVNQNGIELGVGQTLTLALRNERQAYEVQGPLVYAFGCAPEAIPLIVWDMSQIFAVAIAAQTVGVVLFPEIFK